MKNKLFFVLLVLNIFNISQALVISEIMYDPSGSDTGHEWIEVYNDDAFSIDLTQYKLFENNTNHSISIAQGDATLASGAYAVIADNATNFKNDYPGFTLPLFDSAFSLINSSESLSLKNSSQSIVFSTTYTATTTANGTGGTLNYVASTSEYEVFVASPGVESDKKIVIVTNSTNNTTSNNSVVSNLYNDDVSRHTYTLGEMYLLAPHDIYGVAGGDIDFNLKVLDKNKSEIPTNTYWSYGDGMGDYIATATHRYIFPGVYNALVEVDMPSGFGIEKIKVHIVKPDITISDIQDNPASITLKNNSDEEIDLQYASIRSDQGVYNLSKHLVFSPRAEIKISGKALGFEKLTNAKIVFINGEVISEFKKENIIATTSSPVYFLNTNISYDLDREGRDVVVSSKIVKSNITNAELGLASDTEKSINNNTKIETKTENVETVTLKSENDSGAISNFFKKILYFLY